MKPKIQEVYVVKLPMTFEPSEEVKRDLERIQNPQDLNDALLSVKVEEHARKLALTVEQAMWETMIEELTKAKK